MSKDLPVPDHSTLSRRGKTLKVEIPRKVSGSLNLVLDSTGLKIYGEGEWKVRKHGYSKRRTWRKLHLGADPEDGEILVKGQNVFQGYYKNPELTAETIQDGWLHTGDVGALVNGHLKIMDRKKDIIITAGGKNITPAFIENKLKFSPYIQDAVVIGDRRKFLTALILIDEDNVTKYAQDNRIPFTTFADLTQNDEIQKLINHEVQEMNKNLSKVETIKKFALLPRRFYEEDGDVTPTKKVKRAFLEKRYAEMIDQLYKG
jgi:long-chain acyl-CoA synthetase